MPAMLDGVSTDANDTGVDGAVVGAAGPRPVSARVAELPAGRGAGRHRVRLDRYGQLAGALLGFAIAMTVNLATDGFGYPGLIAALMAMAVLATASWLRRLPRQAPLARVATRLLLTGAGLATRVSLVVPPRGGLWCLMAGIALTAIAVLVPTDLATAAVLFGGAALIGLGVAIAASAVTMWIDGNPAEGGLTIGAALASAAPIVVGGAVAAVGLAPWIGGRALAGAALIGVGGVLILEGVLTLGVVSQASTAAVIGVGGAFIVAGVAVWIGGRVLAGGALVGVGGLIAAWGVVAVLADGNTVLGVPGLGAGLAMISVGLAKWLDSSTLTGASAIIAGVTMIWGGVELVSTGGITLLTVGFATIGVALAGWGVTHLNRADSAVRSGWDRLVSDPTELPDTGSPAKPGAPKPGGR